jgi:hypothetical protein
VCIHYITPLNSFNFFSIYQFTELRNVTARYLLHVRKNFPNTKIFSDTSKQFTTSTKFPIS